MITSLFVSLLNPFFHLVYGTCLQLLETVLPCLIVISVVLLQGRAENKTSLIFIFVPIFINICDDILRLLLAFVMWSHLCGCLYWFIGRIQPRTGGQVPWVDKLLIDQPELRTSGCVACAPASHDEPQQLVFALSYAS